MFYAAFVFNLCDAGGLKRKPRLFAGTLNDCSMKFMLGRRRFCILKMKLENLGMNG